MAQVVIKRGDRDFIRGWKPSKELKGNFSLIETPDMEQAMLFNCENDARRFLRCDRRIVTFYQPELHSEFS